MDKGRRPNVVAGDFDTVYTDGGVCGANPSLIGGTWAFVYVKGDQFVTGASGHVTPKDIGLYRVTNNMTELVAMIHAFENLLDGWKGTVVTDSLVSLRRFRDVATSKFTGVPSEFRCRVMHARLRFPDVGFLLVAGHPTRADLERGSIGGLPVSRWNVRCDEMCGLEKVHLYRKRSEESRDHCGREDAADGNGSAVGDGTGDSLENVVPHV